MTRRSRAAGALAALSIVALTPPTSAAPASRAHTHGAIAAIELATQTAIVPTGGTFTVQFDLTGVPSNGSIRVAVHQRVRSRSELAQSMDGNGLRSKVLETVETITTLPLQPDGTRRLAVSLDPSDGGLSLRTEGVYPVELVAQDAAGAPLATVVTHLILGPEPGDDAPPLGVAVVADISAPPALQADGLVVLRRSDVEDVAELIDGLAAAAGVPATIAARPETIDALANSLEPGDDALVEALRSVAADRTVLSLPYTEVSPDELAPAGLLGELGNQTERGREVLEEGLGVEPGGSVWFASPALGAAGLEALTFIGVRRVVVADDQVDVLPEGIIRYSLAQPFLLAPPETTEDATEPRLVQALATDPTVLERLATAGPPGLVTSRVLAELALLRLEQPSVARTVVLPLPGGTPAAVVQMLLDGISSGGSFTPLRIDEAFSHAALLLDGGGNPVERALLPAPARPIEEAEARSLRVARSHLTTFAGLVGADSPRVDPLVRHLLVATSEGLTDTRRRAHIQAVETAIDDVMDKVTTPATFTLTLAERDGTVPLTIANESGLPLHVSVHLRSQKLEFPKGEVIPLELPEGTTRVEIPVRARASGAFPLVVDVTTPDGRRTLAVTRYRVRSTAVSGAGLILSIGAGAFLVVWWARHWRRTRRSARLIAPSSHPTRKPN